MTNTERAARARGALVAHLGGEPSTQPAELAAAIGDLIADLLHLADTAYADGEDVLRTAEEDWRAERDDDGGP